MNFTGAQTSEATRRKHESEVSDGERFEFGKNWTAFLAMVDEPRIACAQESLREMLATETLAGKTFLDIGSGSGLFSLAARRLGARVFSFDYDADSVACAVELKKRYLPDDADWRIEQGSVLDEDFVASLGKFDVVYSWGVLHHTGEMWTALANAHRAVAENGKIFIAVYNDTGSQAARWKSIKKIYCRLPKPLKTPFAVLAITPDETKRFLNFIVKGDALGYVRYWTDYRSERGMNRWRDIVDWVGGYPYEVATPDEIFEFYAAKNYRLTKLKCGLVGLGCNQFVFQKEKFSRERYE